MADTKLSDLSSGAPAAATDIIYAVKDPSGTPADAKLTLGEVKTLVNTPGGSDTQVQFNDSGAFAGDAGFTFNKTSKALTLTGASITTSSPVLDLAQTWNASGTTFTGLRFNATDTASASASLLMDLQVGGNSQFSLFKNGGIAGGTLRLGAADTSGVSETVTITIASPGVITWTAHGLSTRTPVVFTTTGALPTGITSGTTYYVINTGDADTFRIATTAANASAGTAITTSGSQSGTHTGTRYSIAQYIDAQSNAGVSNRLGADTIIRASAGTGNAASGSIILQAAITGSSGTQKNTFSNGLIISATNNIEAQATFPGRVFAQSGLDITGGNFTLQNTAATFIFGGDVRFTRRAAANLQLGAADAASPVAQTLSVQSVVAGTSNTAGANLTITGSQGTGTGAGGSIIFQVAPAGTTGTAQNALATALTIDASTSTTGVAAAGSLSVAGGRYYISSSADSVAGIFASANKVIGFSNSNTNATSSATYDVLLARDAANTLALRNGNNGQTLRVYGRYTSDTNHERFFVTAPTTSGAAVQLGTDKGSGGGTARNLEIQTDGTTRVTVTTLGNVVTNTAAVATTATDGFLYVPTCAGTPTGTPTTQTGTAPIVVDTTNNKLYFYSGGQWRDAGP